MIQLNFSWGLQFFSTKMLWICISILVHEGSKPFKANIYSASTYAFQASNILVGDTMQSGFQASQQQFIWPLKGCVYDPFCSNIFPRLWAFWFNPISLFALFITFGEVLALVRIDLVFLVICQLLMIWIELWCHDCLLKKWCF